MATIEEINSFLLQVKLIVKDYPDNFTVRTDRPRNRETMFDLGLTPKHVGDEVCKLTYKNYTGGPETNTSKDGPKKGSVWKFGTVVQGQDIYIKLHLVSTKKHSHCVCVSFHKPDFPLIYH